MILLAPASGRTNLKITLVGHAALLIEANGLRILSDPWWQGPCFGNQWWIYPKPHLGWLNDRAVDYIYISHGHADHFHRGTLRRFPRGTKVLVAASFDLGAALREMGFDVIEVGEGENHDLGSGVTCRIMPTYGGDSLMAIADGKEVCINANDALHAAPPDIQEKIAARLKRIYPRIDYVFCGYGIASHFPNCYVIPGKDRVRTAIERQRYFNRQWSRVIGLLRPRFGFPFAADVVLLEPDLFWANEPTHNTERPTDVFASQNPDSATTVCDIAPGFSIADGKIVSDIRFEPVRDQDVRREYGDAIEKNIARAERTEGDVQILREGVERNIAICRDYLREYAGDYRFLILIRDRPWALEIKKTGNDISVRVLDANAGGLGGYDISLTSYFSYLRRSFSTDYGNETLYVGSGCIIEYTDRRRIKENLHRELTMLIAKHDRPPKSRFGDQPKWLFLAKRFVNRALGRVRPDLYDLSEWTYWA